MKVRRSRKFRPAPLGIQVIEGEAGAEPIAPPPVPEADREQYAILEGEAAKKDLLLSTCLANQDDVCYRVYDSASVNHPKVSAPMFGSSLEVVRELIAEYKMRSV